MLDHMTGRVRGARRGRRARVPAALAALTVAAGALAGCAEPAAVAVPPAPVVLPAEVTTDKVAAPTPSIPAVDLTKLTVIDPKHVVRGLPGLDGLEQLENDDPALGRWRTAVVTRDTAAYDEPHGEPLAALPAMTFTVPTTVPVVDATDDGWLRVMVATRGALPSEDPSQVNGRTAWIRARDTRASGTDWRVSVDIASQTITVDDGTGPTTVDVIATGAPDRPTPRGPQFVVGTFWVDPHSYTPRVILLSTQSETMDAFDAATGTSATAIHTTSLSGRGEISNGCIRVSDSTLDLLWLKVPGGTVVDVA